MSYNHVYKTIYCTYIEYALLCNVKMICERRTNAMSGLCRCAGRSWLLLSAKYKYKHVAIHREIWYCLMLWAICSCPDRNAQESSPMGTIIIRAEEQWYGPSQWPECALTWSGLDTCSTVNLFSYACPQTVLCITHLYIYYCIRERERERDSSYPIESIIIPIQFSVIPNLARYVEKKSKWNRYKWSL